MPKLVFDFVMLRVLHAVFALCLMAVRRAVHDTDFQSVRRRHFRGDALPEDWLLGERRRGHRGASSEPEAQGLQAHHRPGEMDTCVRVMSTIYYLRTL